MHSAVRGEVCIPAVAVTIWCFVGGHHPFKHSTYVATSGIFVISELGYFTSMSQYIASHLIHWVVSIRSICVVDFHSVIIGL